jgi:hypothetical protein
LTVSLDEERERYYQEHYIPVINLFLDSSALIAGIISGRGAPHFAGRMLLLLTESGHITITISEQVLAVTERASARKVPRALNDLRQAIQASKVLIVRDPSLQEGKVRYAR